MISKMLINVNENVPYKLLNDPLYRKNVREIVQECNPAVNRAYIKLLFNQHEAQDDIHMWMIQLLADYCQRIMSIDFSPDSLDYILGTVVPPDDASELNTWRRTMLALLL
jgi:predicted metal-binding protein